MSVILFLFILGLLVFVHELGHFLVAKWMGMRVDSFAVGFSPNLWKWKRGETTYKINLIPFGGYVKIHGENYDDGVEDIDQDRSFGSKAWWQQALVLVAGVTFNFILAWVALVVAFLVGFPALADSELPARARIDDVALTITQVAIESPADVAGIIPGDQIIAITLPDGDIILEPVATDLQIAVAAGDARLTINRKTETFDVVVTPELLPEDDFPKIGVAMAEIGTLKLPFGPAVVQSVRQTVSMTGAVATGLGQLIVDAVRGEADLDTLSGPVGIVGLVGDAQAAGIVSLLTLLAVISLNLAVLNLIPFPALDGGRLLFVFIEAITGRKIPVKLFAIVNTVGFVILIGLMILVTVHDVGRLF